MCEQLELNLFPGVPWNGRSPRVLTRGHLGLILKAKLGGESRFFADANQLELFERGARKARSPLSEGASPLLPLPPLTSRGQ